MIKRGNIKVLVFVNENEGAMEVAERIAGEIRRKPVLKLGLATGRTMIPIYKELILLSKSRRIRFSKIKSFNLDEFVSLSKNDKRSLRYFMDKNLFNKIRIEEKNIHFPDGKTDYDKLIKKSGGIDLQVLGLGVNGHIAFNEPGSSFRSKTRKVKLSKETIKLKKLNVKYAYTMGIGSILKSKKIILVAFGKEKAEAVRKMIELKPSIKTPASSLQKHKDVLVFLDRAVASKLKWIKE
ncbi:MAG: glucosamine-6-phosphate deaminase [archaeon]